MMGGTGATTFPQLGPDEQAHGHQVLAHLKDVIECGGGWISFADYMQHTLYAPGLGYYSAGATKLGPTGDFVTAPEISELFAPVIARVFGAVLGATGGGVLELGAGTGRFAGAAIAALAAAHGLPARYDILEVSADLQQRQRQMIAHLAGAEASRAHWLTQLPERLHGIIFANEVLDALPTERFVMRSGRPRRLGVSWKNAGVIWCERSGAIDANEAVVAQRLGELSEMLPEGYVGECCLHLAPWIASLADALEEGAILLIDYGLPRSQLYHPQRMQGTLRCYFRHRAHEDPFFHPGLCDITAWVDFTAVASAATCAGLELFGFTTQAGFLLENDIESLLADDMSDARRARLAHGARQLLLPGEMGESVKVMALTRNFHAPLRGFSLQDLMSRL